MDSTYGSPLSLRRIDGQRLRTLLEQTAPKSVLIFGTGPFQRRVLLCTHLCLLSAALHRMALTVLARPVDHWCRRPPEYEYVPIETWKNVSLPRRPEDGGPCHCTRYDPPLADATTNRTEVTCEAWEYDLSIGGPTIVSKWDLVCQRRWLLVVLMGSYLLGGVVAMPLAGLGADRLGRRPVLYGAVLLLMVSSMATCVASTLYAFAMLRIVTSAAASVAEISTTLILFEVTPRGGRTGFLALAVCGASVLSPFWLSMSARFTYNWSVVQASIMVSTLLLVPATYWLEESPRWLVVTWQFSEAERVVFWAARVNGLNVADMRPLFRGVVENVKSRQRHCHAPSTVWDLVRSRAIRARSLIVFGCWFFVLSTVMTLRPGSRLRGSTKCEVAVMYCMGPLLVVHYLLMQGWGRRRTLALGMALLSGHTTALAVLRLLEIGLLSPMLICASVPLLLCVFCTLFVYTAEVFPTVVRGMGFALSTMSGRLGALAALVLGNVTNLDAVYSDTLTLLLVSLGTLGFGLLALLLPETNVLRVADTIQEAEQEEPVRVNSLFQILLRRRGPNTPSASVRR
ncbi:solute carrier family 22 member 7-like [Amblyomma americanum]